MIATDLKSKDESTANVTITLTDKNDNYPVFDMAFYNTSVHETEPVGSVVITITVSSSSSSSSCSSGSGSGSGSDSSRV